MKRGTDKTNWRAVKIVSLRTSASKIDKMRSFLLLLLLSLMTGCEASSEVKACSKGWVEFTCEYPKSNTKYNSTVVDPSKTPIQSTPKDDRVPVYRDTNNKKLTIKQLQPGDFGMYQCRFAHGSSPENKSPKLEVETDGCQGPFIQTAYKTAETTITCDYPGNNNKSKFFCTNNSLTCEDILSTKSSRKLKGTFTLTNTNSGFKVSISNVASQHAGVYWCGVVSKTGRYQAALRQIQLKVHNITTFKRSPTIGENFEYWCGYPRDAPTEKFICKGEDPSTCEHLVNTAQPNNNTGRFSMKDNTKKRNLTITVREVTTDDTGTYWCGGESTSRSHSNPFFNRFQMTVVPPKASSTSSTFPVSSTQATTTSADRSAGLQILIAVIICVAVMLPLFVLILILISKRFSHSKNTRHRAATQHIKEDYVYEEIQQCVHKPDSNTIYATANFPTNPSASDPSASLHYSNIHFQNSSDRVGGEAVILKPGSAACEYSTVKYSQGPTYSALSHPSSPSEDPLYATVNKPQQR